MAVIQEGVGEGGRQQSLKHGGPGLDPSDSTVQVVGALHGLLAG
jgi:hypothetical protein